MIRRQIPHLYYVAGPDGAPLSVVDLPPPNTQRWVVRRKAQVVAAVSGGLISLGVACERYRMTLDEYLVWHRQVSRHGMAGLQATRIQEYR